MRLSGLFVPVGAMWLLSACASAPLRAPSVPSPVPFPGSEETVVSVARRMLGAPYRYGGTTPTGFDCSGLVQYVYRQVGVELPRSASAQFQAVRPVAPGDLEAGDLLFFKISREKVSHVAIYVASGQFIHAPSRGKGVGYASLREPYWRARLIGAGRVRGPAVPAASRSAGPM